MVCEWAQRMKPVFASREWQFKIQLFRPNQSNINWVRAFYRFGFWYIIPNHLDVMCTHWQHRIEICCLAFGRFNMFGIACGIRKTARQLISLEYFLEQRPNFEWPIDPSTKYLETKFSDKLIDFECITYYILRELRVWWDFFSWSKIKSYNNINNQTVKSPSVDKIKRGNRNDNKRNRKKMESQS